MVKRDDESRARHAQLFELGNDGSFQATSGDGAGIGEGSRGIRSRPQALGFLAMQSPQPFFMVLDRIEPGRRPVAIRHDVRRGRPVLSLEASEHQ